MNPPQAGTGPKKESKSWLWIVAVIILIPAFFFGVVMQFIIGYWIKDTRTPPGDPRRFDPVREFGEVKNFVSENAVLISLHAGQVRSDGTIDLKSKHEPRPQVTYAFARELEKPPKDAPPIGAGGSVDGRWYEPVSVKISKPWQSMSVTSIRGGSQHRYIYMNFGMEPRIGLPVGELTQKQADPPRCPFSDFWKVALAAGAPENAVADIRYDANGYAFRISGTTVDLRFGKDCNPLIAYE